MKTAVASLAMTFTFSVGVFAPIRNRVRVFFNDLLKAVEYNIEEVI